MLATSQPYWLAFWDVLLLILACVVVIALGAFMWYVQDAVLNDEDFWAVLIVVVILAAVAALCFAGVKVVHGL